MPYPSQTDRESIIRMAQTMIERDGVEQLSLAQLAAALNIKAPSLYRHIPSKTVLLLEVNSLTFQQLFQAYAAAVQATETTPKARLFAILRAHRVFAHAHPQTYVLAFTTTNRDQRPDPAMLERLVLPIQAEMEAITGTERSLAALRGALALVHGFVMLELNEQFQRGGDLAEAFEQAITAYLAGVQHNNSAD
jgi:AcrR family transcriptional regulator